MLKTNKQDRQAARTAADLERRYNFGKSFAEVIEAVNGAQNTAEAAEGAVKELDKKLDQEEIFNRLTNDGKTQGVLMDESGNIYVNASFIATGTLGSNASGRLKIDLESGGIEVLVDRGYNRKKIRLGKNGNLGAGFWGIGELYDTNKQEYSPSMSIQPFYVVDPDGNYLWRRIRIFSCDTALQIAALAKAQPDSNPAVRIGAGKDSKVIINDKVVRWQYYGDGMYELVGTDE